MSHHAYHGLLAKVKTCDKYTLYFGKSINKPLKEKHVDVLVRRWDGDTNTSRYFDSHILAHAKSEDLYDSILSCCDSIGVQILLRLSVDEPNVNWKL